MSMNHRTQSYLPDSFEKHPMNRLDKQYDKLIGSERNKTIFLLIVSIVLLIYLIGSLFLFKYAVNLPKSIPMVIEVAPWGEAVNVGDISKYSYDTIEIPERHRQWVVKEFIRKLRCISSDPQVVYDNVSSLFYMITASCADQVRTEIRNPDVFALVGRKTISVTFDSIIRASEKTYQVDWIENTSGENTGKRRYRGLFTIEFLEPSKEQSEVNPLGVFIKEYDIVKLEAL